MNNLGLHFKKIICEKRDICTSDEYHCRTCLRNKANKYEDKFYIYKSGYNPLGKWRK